ncbi:MAG: hypothetical protein R6U89_09795 [Dehalococcoidia bacterium]
MERQELFKRHADNPILTASFDEVLDFVKRYPVKTENDTGPWRYNAFPGT